jgi:hypothetical protein
MSPKGQPRLEASAIADSTSLENSTTETAFDNAVTYLDGLQPGDVIEVIGRVWVEDNNSTDTLTLKLYVGTEEIVTTGAVDVADNDVGFIHAWITVRATGASGSLSATALHALGVPGTVTAKPARMDAATEDLSGVVTVQMKGTWSVAHADNECQCEDWIVMVHRRAG